MRVRRLFTRGALLSVAIAISLVPLQAFAAPGSNDYSGNTLYFDGQTLISGPWGKYYRGTAYVDYINGKSYGYSEPGIYELNIIPRQNPSSGYVMPNKKWKQVGAARYAKPVNEGGGAIGTEALADYSGSNDREKLFNLLKDKNTKGTDWEKMGSAHIVHQMLKHTIPWEGPGKSGRAISAAEWTELYNRLVLNPNLSMEMVAGYESLKNTAGVQYSATDIDVIDIDRYDKETAWVFRDNANGGAVVYALEVICANPMGEITGLPSFTPKPKTYSLTPSISVDKKAASVEPGDVVKAVSTVTRTGEADSGPTRWQLVMFEYKPATKYSDIDMAAKEGPNDACGTYLGGAARTSCKVVDTDHDKVNVVFRMDGKDLPTMPEYTYTIPDDTPVGTKFCFTTSVSPPTETGDPKWRHAALQCVIVAKRPKMQVWGSDVRVGGSINTSVGTIAGRTYGSWGEYAALSNGANSGFATGAGLINGNASDRQSMWSKFTFANPNTGSCLFGCYNFSLSSDALIKQFDAINPPNLSSQRLNDLASGTYKTGAVDLTSTTISSGKSIIIKASGIVTISGNITYSDGPYSSPKQIPQVVIMAPEIRIRDSVTRVDAWLFATTTTSTGLLNTCVAGSNVTGKLTADICNQPLVINGPVVADKVLLRRTAGSGAKVNERGDPAETFNLRADAFIWGSGQATTDGKVQTVYTKELPPRL